MELKLFNARRYPATCRACGAQYRTATQGRLCPACEEDVDHPAMTDEERNGAMVSWRGEF